MECWNDATEAVKARVVAARGRQIARQGVLNAQLEGRALRDTCGIPESADRLLGQAVARLGLSARAVTRVLRVARTIADVEGVRDIGDGHVAEALQFRVPA